VTGDVRQISLSALCWTFLKIGALAVGDTGSVLAMVERDLIDRRHVLIREDVTEALTYTKPLPGSTVVQIVAFLAYKLAGWPGSAAATVAYVLPSFVLMLVLAVGYVAVTDLPAIGPTVNGLTAAAVGILLATAWRLGQRNIDPRQPVTVAIALGALVAGTVFSLNGALIVVFAGLVGIVVFAGRLGAPEHAGAGAP
jgi:chromate transporter